MRRLNFILAIRQLTKNKGFTLLNILGLTLGLTTFLLITLYVVDELSFDRFNSKADRIVRLNLDVLSNGQSTAFAIAAPPVAATLKAHYPEVETAVRICPNQGTRLRNGDQELTEQHVAFADPGIFDVFTLPMIEGDPHTALNDPHSLVLTETTALRYFHTVHALGRTLQRTDDPMPLTVTGVIRDFPQQSSFRYDLLLSMHANPGDKGTNFYALTPMATFVLLRPGADRAAFDRKLSTLMRSFAKEYAAMEDENHGLFYMHIDETPLTAIHLHSDRADELGVNGNIQYIYIFSAIALFVLLIAAINFMNLSTARSANRAREVGVRKVLGSPRSQLIGQFLTESLILTLVATIIALGLTLLVLPAFDRLTGKDLSVTAVTLRWLAPSLLLIVAVVGIVSGAYPAFFLSAFRPVQVLKGKLATVFKGGALRSTLVVIQFSISLLLIVGTLVVNRQLHFIRHRDPGYDRSQVLTIKDMDDIPDPMGLKQQLASIPGVDAVTLTGFTPTNSERWHNFGALAGKGYYQELQLWIADEDYIPTMGMHIVKGRNFSKEMPTDSNAIIINEATARLYGISGDPLNKTIRFSGYHTPTDFRIIGVVRDFNFSSVRSPVGPLAISNRPQDHVVGLAVRIAAHHTPDALAKIRGAWTAWVPHRAFNYSFMDEDFDAVYRTEARMGSLVIALTTLAIIIACLGLFGLAAYAAEQRAREIGIRKVLGAEVSSIVALLSRDFARLIAISVLIATPLAWLAMHRWLEDFAYRTDIGAWAFLIAAGIILAVAMLTTLFQSLKAAIANPVDSLRSE